MSREFDRILKAKVKEAVKETRESSLWEGARTTARTMIEDGSLPLSKIAKFSGLSIGEVERIKNGIKA